MFICILYSKEVKEWYMKKSLMLVLVVCLVLSVGACGKSAKPVPFEGSGYPHTYPYNQ